MHEAGLSPWPLEANFPSVKSPGQERHLSLHIRVVTYAGVGVGGVLCLWLQN